MFYSALDYLAYIHLLMYWAARYGVTVVTYCLMPNHVHLVVIPESAEGLSRFMGQVHRAWGQRINKRLGRKGHFCQGRFWCYVMDRRHYLAAVRYVLLNPVRAGLVRKPEDWPYSSIRAHLAREDNVLVTVAPLDGVIDDWKAFLEGEGDDEAERRLREHIRSRLPLGSDEFVSDLERRTGLPLRKPRIGRPPKAKDTDIPTLGTSKKRS
jgi:putative transposase